jgi:hypothetical protein
MFADRSMESALRPDGRSRPGQREEAGEALHRLHIALDLGPESLLPDPQLLDGPEPPAVRGPNILREERTRETLVVF